MPIALERQMRSPFLHLLLIASLWLWHSKSIFTPEGILPLHSFQFEDLFSLFGGYRIAFPTWLAHALGGMLALSPLLLLASCYLMIRYRLFSSFRLSAEFALLLTAGLSFWADPSLSLSTMGNLSWVFFLLILLFTPSLKLIEFWVVLNSAGFLALLIPSLNPTFLWLVFSLCLRESMEFLLAKKSRVSHAEIHRRSFHIQIQIGIFLSLLAWLVFIQPTVQDFSLSRVWWLSFVSAGLCVVLSYLKPWESKRWFGMASYSLGLLLLPQLAASVVCLIFLLLLELAHFGLEKIKFKGLAYSLALSLIVSMAGTHFIGSQYSTERSLSSQWIGVMKEVSDSVEGNLALVGDSFGLVSFFNAGKIIENPDILLEKSEAEFSAWMKKEDIDFWLIDREFLMGHWRQLIKSGYRPDDINMSLLSRISLYRGEAVETKTLEIQAVRELQLFELSNPSFIIIQRLAEK